MFLVTRCLTPSVLVGLLAVTALAQDPKPADKKAEEPKVESKSDGEKQEKLEKEFTDLLTKSVLIGRFTLDNREGDPAEDRYEIGKVTKVKGTEQWLFTGIKYGKKEIPFPLVIRVVWADDTPMMTMDKLTIPGLGTFSFRLMFHGKRYAGSWQHDEHGGHMWGRVEKQPEKPADAPKGNSSKEGDKPKDGDKKDEDKENASLSDRLKAKVELVEANDEGLRQVLDRLGTQTGVKFEIMGDDLKANGITQFMKQKFRLENEPATRSLDQMLTRLRLCVVLDARRNVAVITSEKAAASRGWQPLSLK